MNKQTSSRVSSIAGRLQHLTLDTVRVLVHQHDNDTRENTPTLENLVSDIHALAGSALSQDETPGQEPTNFLDRLKCERGDLNVKVTKLEHFIERGCPGISDAQRQLLDVQFSAMTAYLHTLDMRLTDMQSKKLDPSTALASTPEPNSDEPAEPVTIGEFDQDRDGDPRFND